VPDGAISRCDGTCRSRDERVGRGVARARLAPGLYVTNHDDRQPDLARTRAFGTLEEIGDALVTGLRRARRVVDGFAEFCEPKIDAWIVVAIGTLARRVKRLRAGGGRR